MNELYETLLADVRESIERGDADQAANHCAILLEHLMQDGATDETLARSIGRLEDVRHARQHGLQPHRRELIDDLHAKGFKPSKFTHSQFLDGYQLALGHVVFTFTAAAEVRYIRQLCEAT